MATESLEHGVDSFDEVALEELDIYARFLRAWLPASVVRCPREATVRLVHSHNNAAQFKALAGRLGPQVLTHDGRCLAHINYHAEPIDELLQTLLPTLRTSRNANLLFLHQVPFSETKSQRLTQLRELKRTDLLISVSSDWFQQLVDTTEAQHWGIARSDINPVNYSHIHRFMTGYFKCLFGQDLFVAPFSLRRGPEIFGLVFVSHYPLKLEKFLRVAWHQDPYTSVTNFDLYDDGPAKLRLGLLKAQKILQFQKELMSCLECGKFMSDRDIYLHSLQRGFLGRHARETVNAFCNRHNVRFMTRAGKLARARLSSGCIRRPRPITFH